MQELRDTGVRVVLGGDGRDLLDLAPAVRSVVVSPGLPDDLPLLRAARDRGLPVLDEAELGWRLDPRPWVGVTGTNGKSTSVRLVAAVLRAAGHDPVLGGNTYAAPPLTATARDGDVVVAELSSFQLERTDAFLPAAAVLTPIGVDHLDRHGTRERYAAAKARLLLRGDDGHVPAAAIALRGDDDDPAPALVAELRRRGGAVRTFGLGPGCDVQAVPRGWDLERARLEMRFGEGAREELTTRLPGAFGAVNAAGALALADVLGLDRAAALAAVASQAPPPGRLERVELGGDVDAVLDFAKNPGGVAAALAAVEPVAAGRGGRVIAVVSAVPVADPGALGPLGRAAAAGADVVVVTTDRWTPRDPERPGAALVEGARSGRAAVLVEPDRRAALAAAVGRARRGDVVCVLGRPPGASRFVEPGPGLAPCDDAVELREAAATRGVPA